MKFNILNNEPIQFFNAEGVLVGTIQISGSGDMIIRPESGSSRDIILGDQTTVGDVEIGLPSAEANLKLMGGGLISANGNTLTIGDSAAGDQLIFGAPITASLVQSSSFAVTASYVAGANVDGVVSSATTALTASFVSSSFEMLSPNGTRYAFTVNDSGHLLLTGSAV